VISLRSVTKSYPTKLGRKYVLTNVSIDLPDDRNIAILGRNGAGKSTLLRLLGGIDYPDTGTINSDRYISWPLGLSSGHPKMTGRENTRFVARVMGASSLKAVEHYVVDFAELGKFFDLPISTYSSGMKARLNFGLSMAFDFDTYLMDEITAVGDPKFKKKAQDALNSKREKANIIMVSHSAAQLRKMCDYGILLHEGQLTVYEDIEDAISRYESL
tara:strand:- start:3213 stop:3860 length:648 start_codon:yes stop_codon:yes gene_type:complete